MEQELNLDSNKVKSISNAMNLEEIRSAARQSLSSEVIKNDLPFIVGIGRLARQKGFDLLIESHATVLKKGIPHRLILVGEGEERTALSKLCQSLGVAETVTFLGFVTNPYPILARASLFCLSSRYEGFPLSLIEATVLGIPTIATDCPTGPQEILANGLYGDLVETESVEALSNAIEKHFREPSRLIKKSQDSAKQAERFSLKTCAKKYTELIDRYIQ